MVKYILSAPIPKGRLGKWMLSIAEYDLRYESAKAVKAQVLADLIVEHGGQDTVYIEPVPWMMFFDGSICKQGCGIGLVLVSHRGAVQEYSIAVEAHTNNQVEYEAVLRGLRLLRDAGADFVEVLGDSLLVVSQLADEYECRDEVLRRYREKCQALMKGFRSVKIGHIPREQNAEANNLAQLASGYRLADDMYPIVADIEGADWRAEIQNFLSDPSQSTDRKVTESGAMSS